MDANQELLAVFVAHLPAGAVLDPQAAAAVGQRLRELHAGGQTAWPGVALPLADLAAHIGSLCGGDGDIVSSLSDMHAADLYLAAACARGIPAALRAFDEQFLGRLPAFLSRMKQPPSFVEEMRLVLRERLLVASPGSRPRIAEYSGRGSLLGWVRVVAVRTAISARRKKVEVLADDEDDLPIENFPTGANPEMDYIKTRYRQEFQAAFHAALSKLTIEQRNLLRLHFLDGLNIEKIGVLMKVHRATVARWIAAVRQEILERVQGDLHQRLHLGQSEFDSLVNLVRSQLQVSILRFLKENPP